MINERLFKHYGIDTGKNLGSANICMRPFDTVLVDKQGSCYACECQAWLPQSIGNLQLSELHEILRSPVLDHLRSSIIDGTYRYCNASQCPYIRSGAVYHDRDGKPALQGPERIQQLRLAIDDSCNLKCPSCRTKLIFHKDGSRFRLGTKLSDRINHWLKDIRHPVQVHIGSDGDPFASHIYRYFMETTPSRDNIQYSILTNGLMFREFSQKIPHIISGLRQLGVSIDAGTKEVYEKIRDGGKWERLTENLKHIRESRHSNNFDLTFYFVLQAGNFRQMEDMIELGKTYGADKVSFSKIEDWNVMNDYESHNVDSKQHPDHEEYRELVQRIRGKRRNAHGWPRIETLSL